MTPLPLVSIIMPSYNAARFIAESIESVLAQSYVDWELLITDDCSRDQTLEIAQSYERKDPRLKYLLSHATLELPLPATTP